MKRLLKKPSDYPQFYFRMKSSAEKIELEKDIEDTLRRINKRFAKKQRGYTKGEVLKAALREGLKLARSGKLKLPE